MTDVQNGVETSSEEWEATERQKTETARQQAHVEMEAAIAELSPEDQERVRAAQQQLEAKGIRVDGVSASAKWWGYEIHLSSAAVRIVGEIVPEIAAYAAAALPGNLGKILEFGIRVRVEWMKAVGSDWGCKLVSPWAIPGLLLPLGKKPPAEDTNLWWTVFETGDGKGWKEDEKFAGHHSQYGPALAEHNGRLFCMHRGAGSDTRLWITHYSAEEGWAQDANLPAHRTEKTPALASYRGELHCVHRGAGRDSSLWWTRSRTGTPSSWSSDTELSMGSTSGAALVVFRDVLYVVFEGGTGDQQIYYATYNAARNEWGPRRPAGSNRTGSVPGLAVYDDKLHMVYRGHNSEDLYHASFDGENWTGGRKFADHKSLEGPGLAVYGNKLYCVHRGKSGDNQLYYTSWEPGTYWTGDVMFPAHASSDTPAVIMYRDKDADRDQLLCVHRGYGSRAQQQEAEAAELRQLEASQAD